ncbi:hypothetical protein [Nocardia sp. NPDC004711]
MEVPAAHPILIEAIVITVGACHWNCVEYIRPRFTKERLDQAIALERRYAAEQ